MIQFHKKIKEFNLGKVYSYVMETNPSKNLPYHNNFHLEYVAKYALIGAEDAELDIPTQKNIVIAALFHDYNHSGSGKNDDINIDRAIKGVRKFYKNDGGDKIFTEFDRDQIIDFIRSTRYPYIVDCRALSIAQKIIRDADLIQSFFIENYINGVIFGIAEEAKMDYKDMLTGQITFVKNTKFCTNWATKIQRTELPHIIDHINLIKEFFNENSSNK